MDEQKVKTMADVADKAVEKLANGSDKVFSTLLEGAEVLFKNLEKIAPHVWEAMVRQSLVLLLQSLTIN